MRLHTSLLLVLPGVSLAAKVTSQSYETFEASTAYQDLQHESTAGVPSNVESDGFGLPHTEESYVENINGDEPDHSDMRKKLRSRGQCDSDSTNTFTVPGASEEHVAETGKGAAGEQYMAHEYEQAAGKDAQSMGPAVRGYHPLPVPYDPTR